MHHPPPSSSRVKNLFFAAYTLYSALVFVLLAAVVFIPLALVAPKVEQRRNIGRWIMRAWLWLSGVRMRVIGIERLPKGACVVVANHCSYIDGPLLAAALPPRFSLVIKNEAEKIPVVGFYLRHLQHILVERHRAVKAAQDAQIIIDRLASGGAVGIFAEGTFRATPGVHRFKPAGFVGACRHSLPVVPVAIAGTRHFLPEGRRTIRRATLTLSVLSPLETKQTEGTSERQQAREVAEQARAAIAKAVKEPMV